MNKPATISLANVSKRFNDTDAVRDVTLRVDSGEVVGFVGPNGAGKTTTMSMMMGFLRPTHGQIRLFGTPVLPESAHTLHRRIGYAAGDMALPGALSGEQYLRFTSHQTGRDHKVYETLVRDFAPVLEKPLKSLSRGNKQKIALIAALQHTPSVLLLDEPTAGLDLLMQEVFIDSLKRANAHGATVFMSSHILSEVSSVCSRIVFMKAGRLTLDQPIDALANQAGRICIITGKTAGLVKFLPATCTVVAQSAHELKVAVPLAELKPFLRWLLTKDFADLKIEERELDDVFHDMYRQHGKRPR